jgi:hypothetical protein
MMLLCRNSVARRPRRRAPASAVREPESTQCGCSQRKRAAARRLPKGPLDAAFSSDRLVPRSGDRDRCLASDSVCADSPTGPGSTQESRLSASHGHGTPSPILEPSRSLASSSRARGAGGHAPLCTRVAHGGTGGVRVGPGAGLARRRTKHDEFRAIAPSS